ncbi:MAG: hypothetical protein ACI8W7_001939 [Gammaproteobacteria bacterium]
MQRLFNQFVRRDEILAVDVGTLVQNKTRQYRVSSAGHAMRALPAVKLASQRLRGRRSSFADACFSTICLVCALALSDAYAERTNGEAVCHFEQTSPALSQLIVAISNIPSNKGVIRVALYNDPKRFAQSGGWVCKDEIPVLGASVTSHTMRVPRGWYALAVAHDENDNDEIDRILIPIEAYGFSNYVLVPFGPPDYETAKFQIDVDELRLEIPLSFHPTIRVLDSSSESTSNGE